jgi:hypothetical protein
MITMHMCGGQGSRHQLIVYCSAKQDCPVCQLLDQIEKPSAVQSGLLDGETCRDCGMVMQRTGACYTCPGCGRAGSCG